MVAVGKKRASTNLFVSLLFYMAYIFMPITRTLPSAMKAGFIAVALLFLIMELTRRDNNLKNAFLLSIGFVVIDFFIYYGVWRTNNAVDIVDKSMMLFVFWMPLLYFKPLVEASDETKHKIFKMYLVFFSIEMLTTLIGNIIFPMASRELASTQDIIQNRIYQTMNIGGYGFIYALALSLPMWVYLYRYVNKMYAFFIIFGIITIAASSYMTAIALSLIALVVSIAKTPKRAIVWGVLLALIFITAETYLANILNSISESLYASDNHILGERISNISTAVLSGESTGDLGYREELRNSSMDAFWASPLLGNLVGSFKTLGLHSEFVDWLGGTGIIGVALIVVILQKPIRKFIAYFRKTRLSYYVKIQLSICLVLGFLNLITTAPEFSIALFILPVVIASLTNSISMKSIKMRSR